MELSDEDKEFLKTYKAGDYEKPSVTADIVVFTIKNGKLHVMLIKRKNPPFKDKWAIPGGFVEIKETVEEAAKRELKEETNIEANLFNFGVFSDVDRDPRTRVISIAYCCLVDYDELSKNMEARDDAKEVKLFDFEKLPELAFDHEKILEKAIEPGLLDLVNKIGSVAKFWEELEI